MSEFVSKKSAELEYAKMSEALIDRIFLAFEALPLQELKRLQFISTIEGDLTEKLARVTDTHGRSEAARFKALLAIFVLTNQLIGDEVDPGVSDAQLLKEYRKKVEEAAKRDAAKPKKIPEQPTLGPLACGFSATKPLGYWAKRRQGKTKLQLDRLRIQRRETQRRYRARKKQSKVIGPSGD